MMREKNADSFLFLLLMAILPTVLVIIMSFVFLLIPGEKNDIIQSLVVLPFSFILVPGFIIFSHEKINLTELGIKKIQKQDICVLCVCLLTVYIYLFMNYKQNMIVFLSFQTLIVAVSEEFWARGILFYMLRKMFEQSGIVILLSSIIFVFITHMNRDVMENLLYRMPGALLMGFIYQRTEKLHYSILVHYIYNILGSL